jgi:urease accessory protein
MVFAERGEIEGSDVALDGGPGLAGMRCGATLWALGDDSLAGFVEELAPGLPYHADLMAGASVPEKGLMVVRALGRDVGAVRALLQKIWASVRPVALGLPAQPLRLWAC